MKATKQSKTRRQRSTKSGRLQVARVGTFLPDAGDIIAKRLSLSGMVLATGAGTSIPVTVYGSSGCFALPATEWASFQARYQSYRVRAIRVRGLAIQPVETATIVHSCLYRGDFQLGAIPSSAAQVLSDQSVRINATCHSFTDVVTWNKNPNAKLWTATSVAIPTNQLFDWVCASPTTPVLTTATTYYALTVEWEVEFMGSQ